MASVVANSPNASQTVAITRGKPLALIASLTAAASVAQFSLTQASSSPNGLDVLVIVTVGGTIATPGLEASIDGGATWFGVNPRAANGTAPNFTTAGAINSDPAVSSANCYDVSGLQSCALFRFGSASAFPAAVWVAFG